MKIPVFGLLLPLFLILLALSYLCVSNHIWFPLAENVFVDGKPLYGKPLFSDYVPVKSLRGDLFLRNQDHQTQYLISLKNPEVSIISEDYDFIDLGVVTKQALADETAPNMRGKFNTDLTIDGDYVEFTDNSGSRWRVPR